VVNEELALQIRDFSRCHLDLDENSIASSTSVTRCIVSAWMRTRFWRIGTQLNGDRNRFKQRIRFYGNSSILRVKATGEEFHQEAYCRSNRDVCIWFLVI